MITVQRVSDQDGDGTDEFEVTVENLEDNTKSTATVNAGQDPTNQTNWWFSTAQQHFWDQTGVLGPMIAFEGKDASYTKTAQDWIRQTYDGEASAPAAPAGSINSSFAVECDV